MIQEDTIKLLRECDLGIKMGVESIEDVEDKVSAKKMMRALEHCKDEHMKLAEQIQGLLHEYGDEGKEPGAIVKGMSWMKTNLKLAIDDSDATVAELMMDGCNMGIKSLSRYLNEYKAAEERAKDIAKKLIALEESMARDMREFL